MPDTQKNMGNVNYFTPIPHYNKDADTKSSFVLEPPEESVDKYFAF